MDAEVQVEVEQNIVDSLSGIDADMLNYIDKYIGSDCPDQTAKVANPKEIRYMIVSVLRLASLYHLEGRKDKKTGKRDPTNFNIVCKSRTRDKELMGFLERNDAHFVVMTLKGMNALKAVAEKTHSMPFENLDLVMQSLKAADDDVLESLDLDVSEGDIRDIVTYFDQFKVLFDVFVKITEEEKDHVDVNPKDLEVLVDSLEPMSVSVEDEDKAAEESDDDK